MKCLNIKRNIVMSERKGIVSVNDVQNSKMMNNLKEQKLSV
jgi:hypothetical protein